jgi:zinc protease
MPNQYEYSLEFYKRFYRPEYTTIVLVGDVTRERALALTKQHWGDWKRGDYSSEISAEPQQTEPRTAHIDWTAPTLPYVAIAFRGPAYSDEKKDKAALGPDFGDQIDPELFTVFARVKDPKDVDYVRDQILATFKQFTMEPVAQDKLDATRSRQRYGTLMAMNSSAAIARAIAPYIALRRTPETINKLFDLYDSVTSQDIRAAAAEYFKDQNRTVVTLATKTNPTAQTSNKGGGN